MTKDKSVGWSFWLLWVGANAPVWAATVVFSLGSTSDVLLGSAFLGALQWFLCQHYILTQWRSRHFFLWVLANAIGWVLGWGAGAGIWSAIGNFLFNTFGFYVSFLVTGLIIGTVQWLLVSRYVAKSWAWIPTSALAWTAGIMWGWEMSGTLGWVGGGLIYGAITGAALVWLLHSHNEQPRGGHTH